MSDAELVILQETDPPALAGLGEDELLDLFTRVRRVRNKHVGQYRRAATTRVGEARARGAAYSRGQRARDKAEVFEAALARVSTALAKAARRSAADLRAERIAAARTVASGPDRPVRAKDSPAPATTSDRPAGRSPARKKRDAASMAEGARRQARRDARR